VTGGDGVWGGGRSFFDAVRAKLGPPGFHWALALGNNQVMTKRSNKKQLVVPGSKGGSGAPVADFLSPNFSDVLKL